MRGCFVQILVLWVTFITFSNLTHNLCKHDYGLHTTHRVTYSPSIIRSFEMYTGDNNDIATETKSGGAKTNTTVIAKGYKLLLCLPPPNHWAGDEWPGYTRRRARRRW